MAALPPADGVPGGEAGLGLPGVLGLDDLQEKQNENKKVFKVFKAVQLNVKAYPFSPKIYIMVFNLNQSNMIVCHDLSLYFERGKMQLNAKLKIDKIHLKLCNLRV